MLPAGNIPQINTNETGTEQQGGPQTSTYYRMTSTSDEEFQGFSNDPVGCNNHSWQNVKRTTKKRKINNANKNEIVTTNRYSHLSEEKDESLNKAADAAVKTPKPPPIFVYGVINYKEMITNLNQVIKTDQFTTKTLTDNTIKINSNTPEDYRKLIHHMRNTNIIHHTYQPKENRAFRVVIKKLHHSTPVEDIKEDLTKLGHTVRNIHNGRSRVTKEPLNLFFVDLEPADNNKEIYNLRGLQNRVVIIEPPKKIKGLSQCMRCQQYGHTKAYCNRPYVCVKCGESHKSEDCKKSANAPAKCALCNGPHPANYRGCEFYHTLLKKPNNANNRLNLQQRTVPSTHNQNIRPQIPEQEPHKRRYSDTLRGSNNVPTQYNEDSPTTLSAFLQEFKGMFQQLVQQNNMILNMLSTLITKIH